MIEWIVIQVFIAAARDAACWPKPFRFEAGEVLCSLPAEHFEPPPTRPAPPWPGPSSWRSPLRVTDIEIARMKRAARSA